VGVSVPNARSGEIVTLQALRTVIGPHHSLQILLTQPEEISSSLVSGRKMKGMFEQEQLPNAHRGRWFFGCGILGVAIAAILTWLMYSYSSGVTRPSQPAILLCGI
jgi:hypothetical protein